MAADSLFGGSADSLNDSQKGLLDSVLNDSVGGSTVSMAVAGGTVVAGTGANGETQAAMVATEAMNGTVLNDGLMSLAVTAAAGTVITSEGLATAVTTTEAQAYFTSLLDQAIPTTTDAGAAAIKTGIADAVDVAMQALASNGITETAVRLVQIDSTEATSLDLSSSGDVVQALVMGNTGGAVTVSGASALTVIGDGTIIIGGSDGAIVAGDSGNQMITGGTGADTLIGGSGNDTIMGGAGDTIGFNGLGNFTIGGANSGGVHLSFVYDGVHNFAELAQHVTNVIETSTGVTYEFGGVASITLVGMTAADLTADMINFTV